MNASATFPPPPGSPAASPAESPSRAQRDRRLERLDRMAGAGMEMIEALVAQAKGSGPQVVEGDVGLAFSRVTRAVRLAILLQEELAKGREAPDEAARPDEARPEEDNRDRAVRVLRRVARDHCRRDGFEVSAIAREAAERLDDDDIYGLVASRPVGELVALLCRDFGLEPNWDALAAEAWARAEIAGGADGSPFLDDEDVDDPEPPACRPRPLGSLQEAFDALARDPEIRAAARRESG
jgi:hypothetical protein